MSEQTASCRCGQLRVTVKGEPARVSACHCLNCKKRSGSAFAVQARWPSEQAQIEGQSKSFRKDSDSGNWAEFHFCPECGSDVYFRNAGPGVNTTLADHVAVPLGAFDDPYFLSPRFSVWEKRKVEWVAIVGEGVEHLD